MNQSAILLEATRWTCAAADYFREHNDSYLASVAVSVALRLIEHPKSEELGADVGWALLRRRVREFQATVNPAPISAAEYVEDRLRVWLSEAAIRIAQANTKDIDKWQDHEPKTTNQDTFKPSGNALACLRSSTSKGAKRTHRCDDTDGKILPSLTQGARTTGEPPRSTADFQSSGSERRIR